MTKRVIHRTSKFRSDLRKAHKQGKDIDLLENITTMLANDKPLPPKHRDHALTGNLKDYRECHITPDWLLVYRKTNNGELLLILARLASHSNLNF